MPRRDSTRPTNLLFVRHGSTPTTGKVLPGRARGLELSPEGRAQADTVAQRLRAVAPVDAVYSSPLERCKQTAAPIALQFDARVGIRKGFIECDVGEWTGASLTSLANLPEWKAMHAHPAGFRFPEGESFLEMQARVANAVADIVAAHPGQRVVVVTHADIVKLAIVSALGMALDALHRMTISPCSVTAVAYGHLGPHVLTVNSTDDLGKLRPS
jgi:probable phosphomutase (TIGR03848 family)